MFVTVVMRRNKMCLVDSVMMCLRDMVYSLYSRGIAYHRDIFICILVMHGCIYVYIVSSSARCGTKHEDSSEDCQADSRKKADHPLYVNSSRRSNLSKTSRARSPLEDVISSYSFGLYCLA